MRVLTWNLWGRFGPWLPRKEAIVATLADVGPDLCGLQEVWSAGGQNLAADLAERLGMHWRWEMVTPAPHEAADEVRIGNAILSRWPILADAAARLPTDGTDEGRVAVHARVDAPGGALPMFTTHLTHYPGASLIRLAQVRRLAEFVAGASRTAPTRRWSPATSTPSRPPTSCGCSVVRSPLRRCRGRCWLTPGGTRIR